MKDLGFWSQGPGSGFRSENSKPSKSPKLMVETWNLFEAWRQFRDCVDIELDTSVPARARPQAFLLFSVFVVFL